MTLSGTLCCETFFFFTVFALVVTGQPDGWLGYTPIRSLAGVNFGRFSKLYSNREIGGNNMPSSSLRAKRDPRHHIKECVDMKSSEGEYYHQAKTQPDGSVCGLYIFGEPDQNIEIQFNYLDVPCENGGLVVVVDGWEQNGQVFPSPEDHPKDLKSRFSEFCGKRKIKQTFVSSQNVALIQYRMPSMGASFSYSVRYVKNPTPCNILLPLDETYTLRNYDRRSNCSLVSLFPAAVKVLAINVGVTPTRDRDIEFETGTFYKVRSECQKRGLDDYVQIGGSLGMDNANMQMADSLCGLNSKPARHAEYIGCEITTVRLVSSGAYDNSVTVSFSKLTENDIEAYMSVVCIPDDLFLEQQ